MGYRRTSHFVNLCHSNQRPNSTVEYSHTGASKKETIAFDQDGVCDACRFAEKKRTQIDWDLRKKELEELCEKYRRNDGQYDCLFLGREEKTVFMSLTCSNMNLACIHLR